VVEINEGVGGPKLFLKLLASDNLAGMFEERGEHLERLLLKADSQAMLAQFASSKVQFENSEAEAAAQLMVFWHGEKAFVRDGVSIGSGCAESDGGQIRISLC